MSSQSDQSDINQACLAAAKHVPPCPLADQSNVDRDLREVVEVPCVTRNPPTPFFVRSEVGLWQLLDTNGAILLELELEDRGYVLYPGDGVITIAGRSR